MKKILLVLVACLATHLPLFAQQFKIEKSIAFEEPEFGWNKILQLKNGNTFFFHSTRRDGIEVTVYNKQRKQISTRTLESNLWDVGKMKLAKIVGLHEINGEPVLFVMQADDRQPTLYRMRLNPNTGARMNEMKMGNMPKVSFFAGYAMAFGDVDIPEIFVEKDPNSNCYAVIYFDGLAKEGNARIRVVHYDGTHKQLNTANYFAPDNKYKYLRYIGAVVDSNKRVFLATYGFNGKANEDKEPGVIVSKLNVGDTKFSHTLINVSNDFNDTKSVMLYNRNTNRIQLMTATFTKENTPMWERAYWTGVDHKFFGMSIFRCLVLMSYFDAETLSTISVKPLAGSKIDAYGKQNINKDYNYNGVPQNMVLNKDNTTTVLLEDITYLSTNTGASATSSGRTHYKTKLGPVGVSELSEDGMELNGYAISKKQIADGTLPVLYMAGRSNGIFAYPTAPGTSTSNNNHFLSYDYIYTDKGRYVIFNDLPKNSDKDEDEERRKAVAYVSKTNTMCYKLGDPKIEKFFLFGEPAGDDKSVFSYIASSDFNKEINTYATMIVERDGRDKQAKIAWVTFE